MNKFLDKALKAVESGKSARALDALIPAMCALALAGQPEQAYEILERLAEGALGYTPRHSMSFGGLMLLDPLSDYLGRPVPAVLKPDPGEPPLADRVRQRELDYRTNDYFAIPAFDAPVEAVKALLAHRQEATDREALALLRNLRLRRELPSRSVYPRWGHRLELDLLLRYADREAFVTTLREIMLDMAADPLPMMPYLAYREVSRALLGGALGVKLDPARIEKLLAALRANLNPPPVKYRWKALLKKLGGKPARAAREAAVQALEERVGPLPPSYRSFLRAANGMTEVCESIPRLFSTTQVQWLRHTEPGIIEAYNQGPLLSEDDHLVYGGGQDPVFFRNSYLEHTLHIGEADAGVILLNPEVCTQAGEWEAWLLAYWLPGANRYRSFWELLEDQV